MRNPFKKTAKPKGPGVGRRTPSKTRGKSVAQVMREHHKHTPRVNKALR